MMSGRQGTAPCGHRGVYVVNQYVQCLEGCDRCDSSDGVPEEVVEEVTRPHCKACGSGDTEPFATESFLDCWHCLPCGNVFWV